MLWSGVLVRLVRCHSGPKKTQIYLTTKCLLQEDSIPVYTAEKKKVGKLSKSQKVPELRIFWITLILTFGHVHREFKSAISYDCPFSSRLWISFWFTVLHVTQALPMCTFQTLQTYLLSVLHPEFHLTLLLEIITIDHKNCNAKWTQLSHTLMR